MPADYHTHTPLCKHAEGTPEAFVASAAAAGVSEFGISDHAPMRPEPFDDWRMNEAELESYFAWIEDTRQAAAPHQLHIRAGLECDWLPGVEAWTESLRERYPWDYFIGSVHYLGSWDFDNPKWLGRWSEADCEEVWTRYFEAYREMVRSQLFDILGHADLVKKFNYRPQGDLRRFYEPLIETIKDAGSCIELNTAGWHKPCAEAYPEPEFLKLAASADIPLVISSDAHHPDEVGRDFDRAITLVKDCGFTETQCFKSGRRYAEPLQ